MHILALNTGSSSLRFAVYDTSCASPDGQAPLRSGAVEGIGSSSTRVRVGGHDAARIPGLAIHDQAEALQWLTADLQRARLWERLAAIGHRIVHGGPRYREPVRITPAVRGALETLIPLAPRHLPDELRAVDAMAARAPGLPQIACFDTAFHRDLPLEAGWYAIPRAFSEAGVIRYGFHGLSYEYIALKLSASDALGERTIVAHLGNGASMAALRNGRSVDTSMGFTPIGGFAMGTRTGDLDPGIMLYLLRERSLSVDDLNAIITRDSGLLGISATSSDMRDLLERSSTDRRAAEAVGIFCYQIRRFLGAYVAVLGGLDTLVFTGGIGENAPGIRARICESLDCFGIRIDHARNDAGAELISVDGAAVAVMVIPTNEELMIARHTARVLESTSGGDHD